MENTTITFELENTESAKRFFEALKGNNKEVARTEFDGLDFLTEEKQEELKKNDQYYKEVAKIQSTQITRFKKKHVTTARHELAYTMAFMFAPAFVGERYMLINKRTYGYIGKMDHPKQNLTKLQLIALFSFILDPNTRTQELEVLFNLRYNVETNGQYKAKGSNQHGKYHGLRKDQLPRIKELCYSLQKYYTRKKNNKDIEPELKKELNDKFVILDKQSTKPVYKINK